MITLNQVQSRSIPIIVAKCMRFISQFRIPQTDCIPYELPRKVVDPYTCIPRDTGLVLGVYNNEELTGQGPALTPSGIKYNADNGGKLWNLLQLSPIPKLGEYRVFYDVDPKYAFVAVAGLGTECYTYNKAERMDESKEAIRIAAGVGAHALQKLQPRTIHVESFGSAEAAAEGAGLGIWQFQEYRSEGQNKNKVLMLPVLQLYDDDDTYGWKLGKIKAESQNLARFLQEMPANLLNPTSFAKIAVDLMCELDINVNVKAPGWAAAHEMGGFVAIGKSSVQPPLYVEVNYYGRQDCCRPLVLIGKGVTFDSGSLDLKSSKDLKFMKGDMAGAACVLAATRAAALLKLPVNIRGILPLCELMPNCNSPRFDDVIGNANGKSILMRLPSREGRLLIADSLVYARSHWPKYIVDIGTMSKELLATLGGAACGCYSNSEELFCYLESAGGQSGDRVWRMPLWKFYEERIKDCDCADVANTGRLLYGDSPNCAAFLRQFICDSEWAHLDTYNVAYTKGLDSEYLRRGMTGRPTRTIIELILQLITNNKLSD